jgi:hypothetical protein
MIQDDDAQLAKKVIAAVKAYDAADAVKKEKAIVVGRLLAEAQKLHPSDKDFEAFLERAGGIQIRRAKDLIAFALDRKDFEQHQKDNAAAQQRHRDKLKAEKIEREKAKADLPKPEPRPRPKPDDDVLRNASPKSEGKPLPLTNNEMTGTRIADLLDELVATTRFTLNWIGCYPPSRVYDLKDKDLDRIIGALNDLKRSRRNQRTKRVVLQNAASESRAAAQASGAA